MKKYILALATLILASTGASAATIKLSTSNTDPNAGNSLTLNLGASGSMYVWVSTGSNQTITGLCTSIVSSNSTVLEGTAHLTQNPNNRWYAQFGAPGEGTLGDLVTDANAFVFSGQTGISTGDDNSFLLHSEVTFTATGFGTTLLSIERGTFEITDQDGIITPENLTLEGGFVTVSPVVASFVQHTAFAGIGTKIDAGKSLAREGSGANTLTYENLINTAQGINGLVFDVDGLALPGSITSGDFEFQISPEGAFDEATNPPSGWQTAAAPSSVSVVAGSPDRIIIEWPDGAIKDRWLRVTLKATANTGFVAEEVFYIGHLTGESGPSTEFYTVAFADISPIRAIIGSTADSSSTADVDKNGIVAFADISAMRSSVGKQLTNITIP